MCNECWSTATTAARNAHSRLEVAVAFLNSTDGKRDKETYYPEVSAAMNAQVSVLTRRRPDEGARAVPADVHDLSKAQEAFVVMSFTDAAQVAPYRDFSGDREDVSRAITRIQQIWVEDPGPHPEARPPR